MNLNLLSFDRMPWQKLFICITLALINITATAQPIDALAELQWSHRLILIDGSAQHIRQLEEYQGAIIERDIVWFLFTEDKVVSNGQRSLSESLTANVRSSILSKDARVVLIGKDGGIKAKKRKLNLNELFDLIDSMPMRIREMHQE